MNLHTNKEDLQDSIFASECVFKGGTSLSKCYTESIKRFSEDIDLTFIPKEQLSNNQYNKTLKKIENERSDRSKSSKNLYSRIFRA